MPKRFFSKRSNRLKPFVIVLDAGYAPAYVGLGIVYGMKGDLDRGRVLMETAKTLAKNDEEEKEVEMGFERLDHMEGSKPKL